MIANMPSAKPTYNSKEKFYEELSEDTIVGARGKLMRFLQKNITPTVQTPPCMD